MVESTQVLYEITEDKLETGMRGYPVGYCITSSVDPENGLSYMGQSVADLASKEPEEVIYLLFHGRDGTISDVEAFNADLRKRSKLNPAVGAHIRKLPREGHPMKLFCASLLIAGMFEKTNDYKEDALNIVARLPEIAATVINHHAGWGENKPSKPELGYIENFVHMLNVPNANEAELTEVMKLFNILHYDHGGGNLSCFTGKAICSGLEDTYGSLAGAMAALAGPRHGKANQDSLMFVKSFLDALGPEATPEQVEKLLREKLANKELIYGFGHAVLRVEDPRASIFYAIAEEHYNDHPLVKIARHLRSEGPKVLKENPKISDPYPNVDAISGTVLTAAGFGYPEYYTVLFGLSRCVGIARQIQYERLEARGGKGTPIVRPKYYYKPLGKS